MKITLPILILLFACYPPALAAPLNANDSSSSTSTLHKPPAFNGHHLSLEKLYGDVLEIKIEYRCLDQEIDSGAIAIDSINAQAFFLAYGKDLIIEGTRTPSITPTRIEYQGKSMSKIEYMGFSTVTEEFMDNEDCTMGFHTKIGDEIHESFEIIEFNDSFSPLKANDYTIFKSGPRLIFTKKYSYDSLGYCSRIDHSSEWYTEYSYDSLGFLKERLTMSPYITEMTFFVILEFDEHENWTKRLVYNDGKHCTYIEERSITYAE